MCFHSSIARLLLLAQNVLGGAKEACGEQHELTLEVSSLHKVLSRLQQDAADPKSGISRATKERREELKEYTGRCKDILRILDSVFSKYNSLDAEKKRDRTVWQRIKFRNGETKDLVDIRQELSALTAAILMSLKLCSLGSLGKVEARLGRIENRSNNHGHELKDLRKSLHWITASKAASGGEGSTWTTYTNDTDDSWKELRQELIKEGFHRTAVKKYKRQIQAYVKELGSRGVFDDPEQEHRSRAPSVSSLVIDEELPSSEKTEAEIPPNTPTDSAIPLGDGLESPSKTSEESPEDSNSDALPGEEQLKSKPLPPDVKSQTLTRIAPGRRNSASKQVRFVEPLSDFKFIPRISQLTKLPKAIRRVGNHFPFNNLSLSQY